MDDPLFFVALPLFVRLSTSLLFRHYCSIAPVARPRAMRDMLGAYRALTEVRAVECDQCTVLYGGGGGSGGGGPFGCRVAKWDQAPRKPPGRPPRLPYARVGKGH